MFDWCERNDVRYIVGLARNRVLEREAEAACEVARDGFDKTGAKNRVFSEFEYAAGTWRRSRRVIARIEHGPKGRNPRVVVTNVHGEPRWLYEKRYCQRGDMENRLEEQQLALSPRRRRRAHRRQGALEGDPRLSAAPGPAGPARDARGAKTGTPIARA